MKNFSDTQGEAAVTASLIMPDLPDTSLPGTPAESRLILFLASAAQSEGFLSAEAWKKASEAFADVFSSEETFSGEDARSYDDRHFLLQTRFHAALLQPSVRAENFEGDEDLAREFFSLPSEKAKTYASAIHELCPAYAKVLKKLSAEKEQNVHAGKAWEEWLIREEKGEEIQGVVMEGGVAKPRSYRGHVMPLPWKKPLRSLFSAVSRAERLCGSMASSAAEEYEHAADYMRSLPVWKRLSLFPVEQERGIDAEFLRESEIAEELEQALSTIGNRELMGEVEDIRRVMREQPFTLVVVGEGKRGKSSLVNALLGGEFSPVRESVPETSAVACFSWGKKFHGRIQFFSYEECRHISEHFSEEFGHGRTERMEKLQNSPPPHSDAIIESPEELQKFLSSVGSGSTFAAKAHVELPSPLLKNGLVLVDTPGLNASDPVENYLAIRECMAADCLLFVLDARRPDSASEQQLLRMLASSGRAVSIIGVLTGMDLLNEDSSRKEALEQARMLLESSRAFGMDVIQIFAINAREAMKDRCRKPQRSGGKNFQNLYTCIMDAAAS
ncbi:MAG: dynamin family protein, partial [Mailhella sp.]